ncbi:HlyD family efflux transporter periplasmic adaptor subunit [Stenotrophomonas pigmentata]|uniref:HlyD family efflux transporter periplasmic adaptor subunit n=1 Tax=Stenotrophomonas pigmentata TaxID=3055080 RepID=UPI0026EDD7DA|nr:HlyD family efflux transporter periplasmic adaptor subunit [Stenotrophomonas sp. 610A2]
MKKPVLVVVAAAVVLAALFAWWWSGRDKQAEGALLLQGNVDIRQVSLAFDGSGRVQEVRVEEGDQVKAGEVLATLDTRTLQLQADQAKAQIETHRQTVARLRNGARPQEVIQARSQLAAAQADAARTAQDLQRLQGVAAATDGRGVSALEMDRARSAAKVAAATAELQQQGLALVEQGPRKEDIAAAEAQLQAADAQLALLQHQIDLGQLKAPVAAVVRSRLVEVGDMASPQRAAFALALTQPKWVRVYASETELGRIRAGQSAQVTSDSRPGRSVAGKVGFISSVAEFTPKSVQTEELRTSLVYEVRVLVDDPDDQLRLGQPVSVRLQQDAR